MKEASLVAVELPVAINLPDEISAAVVEFARRHAVWMAEPSGQPRTLMIRVEHQTALSPEGERCVHHFHDVAGNYVGVALAISTPAQILGGVQ